MAAGRHARRSRFLLANPPLPSYACSKKSAAVCLAPGSPSPACCGGQCVDTVASADHCGGCNKVCKHDRSTCCGGRCIDLLSDRDNCGTCGNQCNKKCNNGFCDYARPQMDL
ncbi:stigma-specific STIG1-like protein 4 [Panicum miliaceum]|uniref:Stigma-specific STIG1-like protein 4 n=1 Tax=Panicum miliaceum TaxID=4540 RepID=A0A3L6R6A2_PANMI|nr:stigma-specific STIG1-like protein 4 [Panicum miliaceum]